MPSGITTMVQQLWNAARHAAQRSSRDRRSVALRSSHLQATEDDERVDGEDDTGEHEADAA
ncbi:MAG: hypothetical protein INH41_30930 [Myxococcaceae bacterium]|nr:hypothetical protein [Myxococcaceae bacterium]